MRNLLVLGHLLFFLGLFSNAHGATYNFSADGTIVSINPRDNSSQLQNVNLGDSWSISFTFDDAVVDADPSATKAVYYDSITDFSLTYSDKEFSMNDFDSVTTTAIPVRDNWDDPNISWDSEYDGIAYDVVGYLGTLQIELLLLFEGNTNIFSSDALYTGNPTTLPWTFDESSFSFRIIGGDTFAGSVSATVVPIPSAVWLFGSGLIGLIGLATRKSRN